MQEFINSLIATLTSFVGVGVAVAGYRATTKEKREKKIADNALLVDTVKRMNERFTKEFDGNSGGSREAINNIAKTQREEVVKSEVIAAIVHRLEGSFEEHRLTHERSG